MSGADRASRTSSRWPASSSSSRCRSASPRLPRAARAAPRTSTPPAGSVTALQNGLALAGDYMSAASFLGIAGLVALSGFDGLIYSIGFLVGWPVVMFLIAEPLRNLGKYTFTDVVAFRLRQAPVRVAAAVGSLAVVAFYLIAQMVGAGNLIRLLFGLQLRDRRRDRRRGDAGLRAVRRHDRDDLGADRQGGAAAGRRARCWRCWCWRGSASIRSRCFQAAARSIRRSACSRPAGWCPIRSTRISLGLALMFGTAGLPHILMRFYTVPDARTARVVGGLRHRLHRLLLPADVHPRLRRDGDRRPAGDSRHRRRRQHGGAAARRGRRRRGVPRLHLRRGLRDDPRGRRRADAGRRGGAVARHLGERRSARDGVGAASSCASRAARRSCWRSSRSCSASLQGPERRLHGRAGLCDRRQRELPGAGAVDVLARASRRAARRRACSSAPRRACC